MSTALYEFFPYGAPDLIEGAPRRLFRATMTAVALATLVFSVTLAWLIVRPHVVATERIVVVPFRELAAPPPLERTTAPPQVVVSTAPAHPAIGIPVPVPDVQAPPEQTIASQEEISQSVGQGVETGSGDVVVVQPPTEEELPKLGDYVYTDELPVLVTDIAPRYPEVARNAEVEGDVLLRVLVGRNGHVLDVRVEQAHPMLEQAAVEAARLWVFKPALSNNRPVAVWIVRKLHFSLTGGPS